MTAQFQEEELTALLERQKINADVPEDDAEVKLKHTALEFGMKPIPGFGDITVKNSKNISFNISKPDFFKSPTSDRCVIFGEAKIEEDLQIQVAEQFKVTDLTPKALDDDDEEMDESDDKEMDESDDKEMDENKIELIMIQFGVSRPKAVKALKDAGGDLVVAFFGEPKIQEEDLHMEVDEDLEYDALILDDDESEVDGPDDEEMDEDDIEWVMVQTGVSRSKAVKALKARDGDRVAAILGLLPLY